MIEAVASGALAFAATNIDDVLVLSVLFARRDARMGTVQIVLGQYLGIGALVAVSLMASRGVLALGDWTVGVLGVVPIALGVRGLWHARRRSVGPAEHVGPRAAGLSTIGVASVTVANGADNIAVYTPLFATVDTGELVGVVGVFTAMVALWCLAARAVGGHRLGRRVVAWAGDYAVPVVLVGLGVVIVLGSGLFG